MKTIHKQVIQPNSESKDVFPIPVPSAKGAKPLCVMRQNEEVCVWYETDDDLPEDSEFILDCTGTGWGTIPDGEYLNSVIDANDFVWHFYVPAAKKSTSKKPAKEKTPAAKVKAKGGPKKGSGFYR